MDIHLPKELQEIEGLEADLHFFLDLMVRKLHLNRHKGFIEGKTLVTLRERLKDEMREMTEALRHESQFNAALECSDVANFAFLLAMACLHLTKDQYVEERDI